MNNSQIFEKSEKFDSKNNEKYSSEEEEEEKDETPGNTFIKVSRASFLSRDSIDIEDTTFEIEVVDSVDDCITSNKLHDKSKSSSNCYKYERIGINLGTNNYMSNSFNVLRFLNFNFRS